MADRMAQALAAGRPIGVMVVPTRHMREHRFCVRTRSQDACEAAGPSAHLETDPAIDSGQ